MAIHHPYQRHIICPPGAKLSDVSSLLLQEGQIAIYDLEGEQDENGLKAVTELKGCPKDEQRYVIRIGRNDMVHSRISDDKAFSTPPFAINEIIDVYASAPKEKDIKVDEVIFGYNGIDPETAIQAEKGDRIPIKIRLTGRPFELLGYPNGEVFIYDYILIDRCPATMLQGPCAPDCDPCEAVDLLNPILDAIKRIKEQPIAGGHKVGDFIEITPVHGGGTGAEDPVEEDMNFYCTEVCDTGDGYALAQIQAAYPGLKVVRTGREFSVSKYQVMKTGAAPDDYEQHLSSILKGCEECPEGYTEVEGGLIYAVSLEDDGVDSSTVVETLTNAVASSAKKASAQSNGVGFYTVVVSKKPTKAEISAFVRANPTATVTYVAEVADMCSNPTVTTASWNACGSCKVSKEAYYITLPDDACGVEAEAKLKAAFPNLEIEAYGTPGGCQHQYKTEVYTNMVCDDCDPMFRDFYVSKAPEPFMGRNWRKLGAVDASGDVVDPLPKNALCGIKFKGIDYLISPSDCLMDKMVYEEGSVRISVSGGYSDEQREAISTYFNPIHTEYKSHWAPRTHLGAELLDKERESRTYFDMRSNHRNYMERLFTNEETRLSFLTQYADISVTMKPARYSNGFGRTIDDHITFHFHVPYGNHQGILDMVNMLAASAGIKPCAI